MRGPFHVSTIRTTLPDDIWLKVSYSCSVGSFVRGPGRILPSRNRYGNISHYNTAYTNSVDPRRLWRNVTPNASPPFAAPLDNCDSWHGIPRFGATYLCSWPLGAVRFNQQPWLKQRRALRVSPLSFKSASPDPPLAAGLAQGVRLRCRRPAKSPNPGAGPRGCRSVER